MIVDIEALYETSTSFFSLVDQGEVIVDRDVMTAAVQELRAARAIPRKYFRAELNCVTYTFVAISLEHAQHILATSCVDPNPDRDGDALEWREMTPEEIARCNPSGDDNHKRPLFQYPLGMWFSSEY